MMLYLRAKVEELGVSYLQFFETAFFWRFERHSSLNDDYCQFLLHGVIPKYAVEFLKHIQQKESSCKS